MPRSIRLISFCLLLCASTAYAEPDVVVSVERNGDAFVIDAHTLIKASRRIAWDVLTDFDHMVDVMSNLKSSRILERKGNTLRVAQVGTARYGFFSYDFSSEREIRLEPMKRILARQISGNARSFASEMSLSSTDAGIELAYHAELVPDSGIARLFGGPFVQHEVEEQLGEMVGEIDRRKNAAADAAATGSGRARAAGRTP